MGSVSWRLAGGGWQVSFADRQSQGIRVALVSLARRLAFTVALSLTALFLLAPAAMAADGVGLWGRTDDKVVTFFSFAVIGFFAILVTVLSIVQIRLESRKDRAREELERLRKP
jgi:hypothetical protein